MWVTTNARATCKTKGCQLDNNYDNSVITGPITLKLRMPSSSRKLRLISTAISTYIGAKTTSLSRRLTMHLSEGAIKKHAKEEHVQDITRKTLTENIDIISSTCEMTIRDVILPTFSARYRPRPSLKIFGCPIFVQPGLGPEMSKI